MSAPATIADVKRVLHRDASDTSIDDALTSALEVATVHVNLYTKQNWSQSGAGINTWTINDRPEDTTIPVPIMGATIQQIRFYRTPSASPYIGKPLIDYEVLHDGLQVPANLVAAPGGGTGTLVPGTTYYWVVTAVNGVGETNGSFEASLTIPTGVSAATVAWQAYGGEQSYNVYRVTAQGTETTNPTCKVASIAAGSLATTPGGTGGPMSVSYLDTGAAPSAGSVPVSNGTVTIPARWIRLHPTVFDMPFEGAVSAHLPDNWSRIEVDYMPPVQVPPAIRDGVALTAAALYVRGPITASAFTSENMGGYSYTQRPLRGQSTGSNEVIPEVAKALLRPYRRRNAMTT